MITLSPPSGASISLPDGLRWADEFDWTPVVQSLEYSLTGAAIIEEAVKASGQPMTLIGGQSFCWIRRSGLRTLYAALAQPGESQITLHDDRTFLVVPARDDSGPLRALALPVVRDSGFADPSDDAWYYIDSLRLMILEEVV